MLLSQCDRQVLPALRGSGAVNLRYPAWVADCGCMSRGICGATGWLCVTRRMPGEERIGCIKVERKEVPLALPWCFLISL